MAESLGLYPFSSPDGQAIPFDIIRPLGLIKQDFNGVASGNIAIPATAELLVMMTTQECFVQLDGAVAAPADGVHTTGLFIIPAGAVFVIDHNAAASFSVIRVGATADYDGTLYVMTATKYKDLRKSAQFARG